MVKTTMTGAIHREESDHLGLHSYNFQQQIRVVQKTQPYKLRSIN